MNYCLKFECFLNNNPGYLMCDQLNLEVNTKHENLKFIISLKLHFQWIYFENKIQEALFQNCYLRASVENLEKLKNFLNCRVMYLGAAELYEQYFLIKEDELKKTMIVKSMANGQKYFCKVYKKEAKQNEKQCINEVMILRMLEGNDHVVRLLEVYESKHNYYMIMEYLKQKLEQDYTHEENQIIIKEILNILDDLNNKFIVHAQIRPKNFMFDKGNVIKLIGFSKAKILDQQDGLDIVEQIYFQNQIKLLIFYILLSVFKWSKSKDGRFCKWNISRNSISWNQFFKKINIKQALSHPFLKCIETDHQIVKVEMNLKFKHSFNIFQ